MDTTTTSDTQSSSNVPTTSNVDPGWIPGESAQVFFFFTCNTAFKTFTNSTEYCYTLWRILFNHLGISCL